MTRSDLSKRGSDAESDGETDRRGEDAPVGPRSDRAGRVAHFRDTVRTAGEWTETRNRIGPGLFDVVSDAPTTEGMDAQLDAQFGDAKYEVRSYTLSPNDRHPSWAQILLAESVDPSSLPADLTIRKVEDRP